MAPAALDYSGGTRYLGGSALGGRCSAGAYPRARVAAPCRGPDNRGPAVRHVVIPRLAVRKTVPRSIPVRAAPLVRQKVVQELVRTPPPMQQKTVQEPVQAHPEEKPTVKASAQLAPSAPAVSLPDSKLTSKGQSMPEAVQPRAEAKAKTIGTSQAIYGPVAPPQFGAAYLNNPTPGYPPLARRMGIEGTVMLKVLVSQAGPALKVEVVHSSGHDVLDRAAVKAVLKWRFIPARRGDSPIDEWVQVPIAFRLNK